MIIYYRERDKPVAFQIDADYRILDAKKNFLSLFASHTYGSKTTEYIIMNDLWINEVRIS